ncbi:hypothetical protein BH18ACT6_BH18ACT6_07390 [soil metagenome]
MTVNARLADPRLARLNRGLLGFRIVLYLSVIASLFGTGARPSPYLVAALVLFTFLPALSLSWMKDVRIEVGVAISVAVSFGLWWRYGSLLAIEILPIFSLTVSGLLLSRRGARLMVALALFLQICAIAVEVAALGGGLPAFHSAGGSLVTRMVVTGLIAGVGLGFVTVGAVLRDYQNEIAEGSRVEARLTKLVRHTNNLINSVAHELRTPLTAVFGFSQALGDAALNLGEMDRFALARTVADESRRLVNVVDNLIVEARVEATGLASAAEIVNLNEEILATWKQFNLEDRWQLRIEGAGAVWADRQRLRQLLTNLVENVVSVGQPLLRVAISSQHDATGGRLVGEFEHGGAFIFEPFGEFSGDQSPTSKGQTGLGLRAARTLAQSMSGDLKYRDGAFLLSLPRKP